MYKHIVPHYYKLKHILTKEQLEKYKRLTKGKGNIFGNKLITFKKTDDKVIFANDKYVFKFLNNTKRLSELYYTYLFAPHRVYSLSNDNSTIIVLKRYETFTTISVNRFSLLKIAQDIKHQIIDYHENFIIHNDIKPSNIVQNLDRNLNFKWLIIDYGLMLTYNLNNIPNLNFEIGTKGYIPKYENIELLDKRTQLFFMFMKDWYGFGKILSEIGDSNGYTITKLIENMNIEQIKAFFNNYLPRNRIYYLK